MHGGTTVKHNRIANKRTHKVRRRQHRPAYYMVKKPNIIKYEKYFKNILPTLAPKSTIRKSTRIRRERIPFDPSVYNTVKTMKNRGAKLNVSATGVAGAAEAHNGMSAVSAAKERVAIVNKARELYGVSDATKNVRAAFISSYMRAKRLGATPPQAVFTAENEIAARMAASAAPASAAPASAAAFAAPAAAAPAFANNNIDNIEEMFAGLSI